MREWVSVLATALCASSNRAQCDVVRSSCLQQNTVASYPRTAKQLRAVCSKLRTAFSSQCTSRGQEMPSLPWATLANDALTHMMGDDARRARFIGGETMFTLGAHHAYARSSAVDMLLGDLGGGVSLLPIVPVVSGWSTALYTFVDGLQSLVKRFFDMCRVSAEEIIVFTVSNLGYTFITPVAMYPSIKATSGEQLRLLLQDVVGKVEQAFDRPVVAVIFDGCGSHFHLQRTADDGSGITVFAMAKQVEAAVDQMYPPSEKLMFRADIPGWNQMTRAAKVELLKREKRAVLLADAIAREEQRGRCFNVRKTFSQPVITANGRRREQLQDGIHKSVRVTGVGEKTSTCCVSLTLKTLHR